MNWTSGAKTKKERLKKSNPPNKLKQHCDESLKEPERDNRLLSRKRIWKREKR
jgi:hypothetical protein